MLIFADGNTEDGCRMSIDKNSGKISTDSQLDYERKQSGFLTIIASDEGSVPLVSSASVIISVTGVNEHTPVFKRQLYTVSVSEDTIVGKYIHLYMLRLGCYGVDITLFNFEPTEVLCITYKFN